ncbi:MAG: mechanosensitive ion channel [Clostridia bacterium]|nr:mechanosensitive ion channel [Clostridia bacterium]
MRDFLMEHLNVDIVELVKGILPIVATLFICMLAIKIIMKLVKKVMKKTSLDKSLISFIERVIKVILYFILILIIADMMSIPVTSLLATFSVVGLAASLAIQDALGNLASGVMILATRPFKSGDYIEGASVSGTVGEINFSHTVLTTPDNKKIHVPNKEIINSVITNYSEQSLRRVDLTFNLEYSADKNKIKEIMNKAIENHPKILKEQPIFVKTTAYQASGIDYTLRVWVNSADYWEVYFDLLEGLKDEFDKNGIEIPYNKMDVHIINK